MAFKKMSTQKLPPRQWALVGYPDAGKSTFASQMNGPLLTIDADHRFSEVTALAVGDVYELSDSPADNVDVSRIDELLRANMRGSGVQTIVVDSLTAILAPIVGRAMLDNESGKNTNKIASFKDKAMAMRLLQDSITAYGVDTLWIYHLRDGRDNKAKQTTSKSISAVELARLRRSLNMELSIVANGAKRGIRVDWARRGRSGMTLWDDSGVWRDMPTRIEKEVYGGLTVEDMERIEDETPTSFASPEAAIAWGFEQGPFRDAVHAQNAYEKLKEEKTPGSASEMWGLWIADVERREDEATKKEAESLFA